MDKNPVAMINEFIFKTNKDALLYTNEKDSAHFKVRIKDEVYAFCALHEINIHVVNAYDDSISILVQGFSK